MTLYQIDDPRRDEPQYSTQEMCCPDGLSGGIPERFHLQSYGTQNLTERSCPVPADPATPECECALPPDWIGWGGHVGEDGRSDMWCSNAAGISEVITIKVPEPEPWFGLVVGLIAIFILFWLGGYRRERKGRDAEE
jgi:hypothetical protein